MTKLERLQHANDLIKVISSHGRRFFFDKATGNIASLHLDVRGRVWFKDDYSGKLIYTHHTAITSRWQGFSHGGTLRSLVEAMRDYITKGQPLSQGWIAPERVTPGSNIWGYSNEDAAAVREAAFKLPIIKAPAAAPIEELIAA